MPGGQDLIVRKGELHSLVRQINRILISKLFVTRMLQKTTSSPDSRHWSGDEPARIFSDPRCRNSCIVCYVDKG